MTGSFIDRWKEIVYKNADKVALTDGDNEITYAVLNQKSLRIATWFQTHKYHNRCIVNTIENRFDGVICMLGALLSGNYYFNIAFEDLKRFEAELLLLNPACILVGCPDDRLDVSLNQLLFSERVFGNPSTTCTVPIVFPESPFAIFSTSGSTGSPKLISHNHQFVMQELKRQILSGDIDGDDIRDFSSSLTFSASLNAVLLTLFAGAKLVFCSLNEIGVSALPEFWRREKISITTITAGVLRVLSKSEVSMEGLPAMRSITVSAEPVSLYNLALFRRKLPEHIELHNGYATTETRGISTKTYTRSNIDTGTNGMVGTAGIHKSVIIVDENGESVPASVQGEVIIEGRYLPDGYLFNEIESQRSFLKMADGKVRFRTGEIGSFTSKGELILDGRLDDMVKINGTKVNLQEIVTCLNKFNGIRESAVFLSNRQRVRAFVAISEGFELETVQSEIKEMLPALLIPSTWTILDELPKTATNKIDKQLLKNEYLKQKEEGGVDVKSESVIDVIKSVWKKELEIPGTIFDEHDFFLDLGGNSLLCLVCIAEIEKALEITLPVGVGYTYTTPATLAVYIEKHMFCLVRKIQLNDFDPKRQNLYLIPPYPGDRRAYFSLERGLSKDYNLYFLHYNPIADNDQITPFNKLISAIADEIEQAENISLLGFSFGGIVSYFVNIELQRRGLKVQTLIILDTPTYHPFTKMERAFNLGVRIVRKAGMLMTSPRTIWENYILNLRSAYKRYSQHFEISSEEDGPNHPAQVLWTYIYTFPNYEVLENEIMLFKVAKRAEQYKLKWDFEWSRYTRSGFRQIGLQGWHDDTLTEPLNVKTIIATLKEMSVAKVE